MASFAPAQAAPSRAPQPRRRPSRPAAARRRVEVRARPRVAGGVLWIAIVAVFLAGIVALNVAALRLNVEVERLDARRDKLASKRDALQTELSTAAAAGRIEGLAVGRLGLVAPAATAYLELKAPRR